MLPAEGGWAPGALRVVVLSPPGGGKRTQSSYLRLRYGVGGVSLGGLVTDGAKRGVAAARAARAALDAGEPAPTDCWLPLLEAEIGSDRCREGFALSGLPRHGGDVELIQALLEPAGGVDAAVMLHVPDDECERRLAARLVHPRSGRVYHPSARPPKVKGLDDLTGEPLCSDPGDASDAVRHRLAAWHRTSGTLLDMFRSAGVLKEVDGTGMPQQVSARLRIAVDEAVEAKKRRGKVTPALAKSRGLRSPWPDDVSGVNFHPEQLWHQFCQYDVDGNGVLDKGEFRNAYRLLEWNGLQPSEKELDETFSKFNGADGKLSFDEFCVLMLRHAKN